MFHVRSVAVTNDWLATCVSAFSRLSVAGADYMLQPNWPSLRDRSPHIAANLKTAPIIQLLNLIYMNI